MQRRSGGVSVFSLRRFYDSWLHRFLDDTKFLSLNDDGDDSDAEPVRWRLERTWLRWSIEHTLPLRMTFGELMRRCQSQKSYCFDADVDASQCPTRNEQFIAPK